MQTSIHHHNTGRVILSRLCRYGSALLIVLAFAISGTRANTATAGNIPTPPSREVIANMTKEQKEARFAEMKERVKVIKAMDKSHLTKEEKKALRMELKNMNKEARSMGYIGGVYISIGALIIIILLLIIILH
jgi:hypothetical protein